MYDSGHSLATDLSRPASVQYTAPMPVIVHLELICNRRPRTHKRHFTAQNVPELRKLVETRFPQESANSRHPWIVRQLIDYWLIAISVRAFSFPSDKVLHVFAMDLGIVIRVHRAKLKHLNFVQLSQALLLEDHRSFRRQLDSKSDDRQDR